MFTVYLTSFWLKLCGTCIIFHWSPKAKTQLKQSSLSCTKTFRKFKRANFIVMFSTYFSAFSIYVYSPSYQLGIYKVLRELRKHSGRFHMIISKLFWNTLSNQPYIITKAISMSHLKLESKVLLWLLITLNYCTSIPRWHKTKPG